MTRLAMRASRHATASGTDEVIHRTPPMMLRRVSFFALIAAVGLAGCGDGSSVAERSESPRLPNVQILATPTLQPVPEPTGLDPLRIRLGEVLFNDPRLSSDGSVSCASCHNVAQGGSNGQRYGVGARGRQTRVNVPTILNSSLNASFFWDGRARNLASAVAMSFPNGRMMSTQLTSVRDRLQPDASMVARFVKAYPDGLTTANIVDALVTYINALVTPDAPFDHYLEGDKTAISKTAELGFGLFMKIGCAGCHQGVALGGNVYEPLSVVGDYVADQNRTATKADYGRFNVTGREQDRFVFRVPGLRNVARTAPYFHDGSAATLDEAIRVMLKYELGLPATPERVNELAAFLRSLSGKVDESLR